MDTNILTQQATGVNFILADGVYDYPDPIDKFVVRVDGEDVAWAETRAEADRSFAELLHYDGEHFKHCPSDYIPFMGEPVPYESDDTGDIGLGAAL